MALSDEEYARQLQAELDSEHREESGVVGSPAAPSAPSPPLPSPPSSTGSAGRRSTPRGPVGGALGLTPSRTAAARAAAAASVPPAGGANPGAVDDEEYARHLQRQFESEVSPTASSPSRNPGRSAPNRSHNRQTTRPGPAGARTPPGNSGAPPPAGEASAAASQILDREYAQRLEQQMRDEDMAHEMQQRELAEQQAAEVATREARQERRQWRRQQAAQQQQQQQEGGNFNTSQSTINSHSQTLPLRSRHDGVMVLPSGQGGGRAGICGSIGRLVSSALCLTAVVITAALVFGLMGGGDLPIPGVPDIPDLSDVFMTDPWESEGVEAAQWRTVDKEGLELTVVNALTEPWYSFFTRAVYDWDNGTPDALQLSVETEPADYACDPEGGKMKVCNGNYGATGWKGVNEVLLQNDYITASVAKMNEYYLAGAAEEEKQYTMCHELGHGFGLGHSDENFFNDDLGTCMDYTNKPQNNQRPSQANFENLLELYGHSTNKNRSRHRRTRQREGNNNNNNAAALFGRLRGKNNNPDTSQVVPPPAEQQQHPSFTSFTSTSASERSSEWRMLKRHGEQGVIHELDLGDGFKVRAHVLLHHSDST